MLDWTNLPALLREIELKSSVFEDRARKAKLFGDPASLQPYSSRDGKTEPAAEELAFVLDGRLDPLSGAPNTIAEVVVEMLVCLLSFPTCAGRADGTGEQQSGFDPNEKPAARLEDQEDRIGLRGEPNSVQDSVEAMPDCAGHRRPCGHSSHR